MTRRRARGIAALTGYYVLMVVLILGLTRIAHGQSPSEAVFAEAPDSETASVEMEPESAPVSYPLSNAVWRANFGTQSAISLRKKSEATKGQALQNLIIFARQYGEALDLSDAVPALVNVYERDSNENLRIMALVALHEIGDEKGMDRVHKLFADPQFRVANLSPRLYHITHAVLSDYLSKKEQ